MCFNVTFYFGIITHSYEVSRKTQKDPMYLYLASPDGNTLQNEHVMPQPRHRQWCSRSCGFGSTQLHHICGCAHPARWSSRMLPSPRGSLTSPFCSCTHPFPTATQAHPKLRWSLICFPYLKSSLFKNIQSEARIARDAGMPFPGPRPGRPAPRPDAPRLLACRGTAGGV